MAEQKRTGIDWQDVRVFLAIARYNSLSAAARALSVNHATVSRRVTALERSLGEKLVERRPSGYILTPAGVRAIGPAHDMEAAAASLSKTANRGATGLVRVSAPPTLAHAYLIKPLAQLSIENIHLDIELASELRSVSLERREADVALRLARPKDGDVIATRLAGLEFGFYGTVRWRERLEAGDRPVFIGFNEANAHLPEALWLTRKFPCARVAIKTNSQLSQAAAASTGAGLALLPHFIGAADSALTLCALEHSPPRRAMWLVKRRNSANPAVQFVCDHLQTLFGLDRGRFEQL